MSLEEDLTILDRKGLHLAMKEGGTKDLVRHCCAESRRHCLS